MSLTFLNTADGTSLCRPFIDFERLADTSKILTFYWDALRDKNLWLGAIFEDSCLVTHRFWIVRFTRRYLLLTSILTFISAIYLKYIWTYPRFNWTKHQKIWKNSKLQDTVDGHLLSYVMLLAILDGSHHKKSQKWLQQRPSTIKFRSITILTHRFMVFIYDIFGNGCQLHVQVEDWLKLSSTWCLLQVSILNHRAMVVICKIFGNGCHPKCSTIWHMIKDDHQWSPPSKLNFWCFANFSMFGSIKFCMDSNEFCIE